MQSVRGSHLVKTLLWAGLSPKTRQGYQSAIRSYKYYTEYIGVTTWSATAHTLEDWAASRVMGSAIAKQGQIKPDTVASYLSALRSWHIDHEFSTNSFETPRMKLLLAEGRSFFSSTKTLRLPITKDILRLVTTTPPTTINELNLDTAFKVAWAGFMRLEELSYR